VKASTVPVKADADKQLGLRDRRKMTFRRSSDSILIVISDVVARRADRLGVERSRVRLHGSRLALCLEIDSKES
jgi:hypothetical protein